MPSSTKTKLKRRGGSKPSPAVPSQALPVTLLSGFLGAGKTTLLQHILRSDHGLKIAVVVNDIGAINVDASLIKKTHHHLTKTNEKVIALQNGCICCTLRGDLLEELVRLSSLEEFDYIIIESSGISEPEQVAETFDKRLAEQLDAVSEGGLDEEMAKALKRVKEAGGLEKFAKLDTTVTVIDGFTMMHDFETADLLSNRRDDVTPEDERTVSDLMVDQIEFADVIILNKMDMVDEPSKLKITKLLTSLNHRAKIIQSSYGKVPVDEIVNTGLFRLDVAQTGYGWLQDLHAMTLREVNGRKVVTPKPETEEYNVSSFVYTRYRPFHPRRLFALLHDKFILQMEHDEEEDEEEEMNEVEDEEEDEGNSGVNDEGKKNHESSDTNEQEDEEMVFVERSITPSSSSDGPGSPASANTPPSCASHTHRKDSLVEADPLDIPEPSTILRTRRAHPLFSRLFRSKGEFHLATRPHRAGDWSQAGAMLTLTGGRPWFCTLPESEYTTGDAEIDGLVRHDIAKGGEWGDRRQELVFIGESLRKKELEEVLDTCLLSEGEMGKWESMMRREGVDEEERRDMLEDLFEDGFPQWGGDDEHDHDHDHDHDMHEVLEEVS